MSTKLKIIISVCVIIPVILLLVAGLITVRVIGGSDALSGKYETVAYTVCGESRYSAVAYNDELYYPVYFKPFEDKATGGEPVGYVNEYSGWLNKIIFGTYLYRDIEDETQEFINLKGKISSYYQKASNLSTVDFDKYIDDEGNRNIDIIAINKAEAVINNSIYNVFSTNIKFNFNYQKLKEYDTKYSTCGSTRMDLEDADVTFAIVLGEKQFDYEEDGEYGIVYGYILMRDGKFYYGNYGQEINISDFFTDKSQIEKLKKIAEDLQK